MADNVLTVQNLHKAWGEKVLFGGLSFGIDQGRKVALLGLNGSGKTTLLRILAGVESDFEGSIARRKDLTHRYLDQDVKVVEPGDKNAVVGDLRAGLRIADEVFAPHGKLGKLLAQYVHTPDGDLSDAIDKDHGWDLYGQAQALAGQLDIELDWIIDPALSGGQIKKIQIIRALIGEPDLVLMDEPTNHLDEAAIRWLEGKLAGYRGTLIVVTHDRYFLENAVDHILELWNGDIRSFPGNYGRYLEKKAELEATLAKEDAKRLSFLRTEIDWIRRGPKARGTKAKARIQRYESARDTQGFSADKSMELELDSAARLGKTILEIEGLSKAYGDKKLFQGLDLSLLAGDRVGVLGPNGSGKTTFLKILLGQIQPDAGKLQLGINTSMAYFDQKRESLDPEKTVWATLGGDAEVVEFGGSKVPKRRFLENFLFPSRMHYSKVSRLSGGEQNRLQLAMALVSRPANLLILDEPTNDLDIATLQVLERALAEFPGCAIVVSHDRFFLDQVATSMLLFSKNGSVKQIAGNYSDYLEWEESDKGGSDSRKVKDGKEGKDAKPDVGNATGERKGLDSNASATGNSSVTSGDGTRRKAGLSYMEKKEWETIESALADKERGAVQAEQALAEASAAGDFPAVQAANLRYETVKSEVEKLFARWEWLDAKLNGQE